MGLRSVAPLLLIFLIILMMFGTSKLREIGSDLGAAIKSFRKGLEDEEKEKS